MTTAEQAASSTAPRVSPGDSAVLVRGVSPVRPSWSVRKCHCRAPGHRLDAEEIAMIDRLLEEFAGLLPAPAG